MNTIQLTETELEEVSGGRLGLNMIRVQSMMALQNINNQAASKLIRTMQNSTGSVIDNLR